MDNLVDQSKKIGEGTYGCVFYPGLNCTKSKVKQESTKEYISKIQRKNSILKNETEIGLKIQQIPNYDEKFSPIIDNCPIKIAEIDTIQISDCKTIKDTDTDLELSKIKYIGDKSIKKYLSEIPPQKFEEILFFE